MTLRQWLEIQLFALRIWLYQHLECEHVWLAAELDLMGGEYRHCPHCGLIDR